MRNTPISKWLHLPLDQRSAFFFQLNREQHFSLSPSTSSFCFLARTFLRRRQRIRLETPFRLISSTGDDPAVASPSRFCSVLETMIQFIQIFNIAYVKIAKEGTMSARRGLVYKIASRKNLKYFCVHSCLTRTRCSKPHLQVSVELPSDDGARRISEAFG